MTGLTADADLYLYNSAGTEITRSALDGYTQDESINVANLAAGTYYIQAEQWSGNTGFTLNLSTNSVSNLLPSEVELGNVGAGTILQTGSINNSNTSDVYHFSTLASSSNFNLSLYGLSADADVRVIRDANHNGIVDAGEEIARSENFGSLSETINLQGLGTGDYFVQVYQYSGNTNYTLTLQGTPGIGSPSGFHNGINNAYDIGTLNGSRYFSDSVSTVGGNPIAGPAVLIDNSQDFYRFSLGTTSNVSLALTGLTSNADVQVIRDSNNNGRVDVGEVIISSTVGGTGSEFLNLQGLGTGDYFVRVYESQPNASTTYNLTLQATPGLGLPPSPGYTNYMGTLNGDREFSGSISNRRTDDWYMFDLGAASNLGLDLSGLTGNLNVQIYQDFNGNNTADANELIATSAQLGALSESINLQSVSAGRYFVRVSQASSGVYSNYDLNLQATPLGISINPTYGTPAQAYNLGFLGSSSTSRSFTGSISSSDTQDYYRFTLGSAGTLNLDLGRLSADADVEILSSTGAVVASSSNLGTAPEQITTLLGSGDYYVHVYQFSGNTNYTANLNFVPLSTLF